MQSEHPRSIIRTPVKRATRPFEFVHSDVWGPLKYETKSGHKYFIVFIDDFSRFTSVYLLSNKKSDMVTRAFQIFHAKVVTKGYKIAQFRCDNGRGEYNN